MEYPITVAEAVIRGTTKSEWVVVQKPLRGIGVGTKVYGMQRDVENGGAVSTKIMGKIIELMKYERRYVVYRVRGDEEHRLVAPYSYTDEGLWRRLVIFLTVWKDEHRFMRARKGELIRANQWNGWIDYIWGPGWRS